MKNTPIKILFILASILISGCSQPEPAASTTLHNTTPDYIAQVNGQPITRTALDQLILPGKGKTALEELIQLEAVRQEAQKQAQNYTDKDLIQQEFDLMLQDMAPDKDRTDQMALFRYMLKSRQLTPAEFDVILLRRGLLRKLIDPNVEITDDQLQTEYEKQYGPKVIIRQIISSSLKNIESAKRMLDRGDDFTQVAVTMSQDQRSVEKGGRLGPFSKVDTEIPETIRQTAFNLTKQGQKSTLIHFLDNHQQEWWAIIQLEKKIPADPIDFDTVKNKLNEQITTRTINERMINKMKLLRHQAQTVIFHPLLKN